jgi:hypothetical protein
MYSGMAVNQQKGLGKFIWAITKTGMREIGELRDVYPSVLTNAVPSQRAAEFGNQRVSFAGRFC